MKTETNSNLIGDLAIKLIACFFILICLAVGLVGLILPIIPGVLFFAVAAMVAANFFPAVDTWLRKSQTMERYLDSSYGFRQLTLWEQVQYCAWFCLKVFIDSFVFIIAMIGKILTLGRERYKKA